MDKPRTIIIGISGCSSGGKTTLARLLRDLFPSTFILHEDDFYKPESELPITHGFSDWDCPEAISIPDLEAALVHIRETGSLPVSTPDTTTPTTTSTDPKPPPISRRLSHRSDHGCVSLPPSLPSSPPSEPPPPTSTSPTPGSVEYKHKEGNEPGLTTSTPSFLPTQKQQAMFESKEHLNSVGASPLSPARRAAIQSKVTAWLEPGQPGYQIFFGDSSPSSTSSSDGTTTINPNPNPNPTPTTKTKTKICLLEGFLLFSPPSFTNIMTSLLDIRIFLRASRNAALARRKARDGYVTLEGFWADPPGYVEKVVWPNYVRLHRWLFVQRKPSKDQPGQDGHDHEHDRDWQRGDGVDQRNGKDVGKGEEEEEDVVDGGELDREVLKQAGINAMVDRGEDVEFGEMAEWAVDLVMRELERIVLGRGEGGEKVDG